MTLTPSLVRHSARKKRILDLSAAHVCPHRVAFWEKSGIPLVIGERHGYVIRDVDGHELIDVHLNGGTFNLGHRNPEVVAAMVEAAETFDIGNHHFPSIARAELAEVLSRLAPGKMPYWVFASGGSEANDIAIKTARAATGRRRVVALDAGYHGRTGLSGAAGEDAAARHFLSDQPNDFATVPFGDLDAVERVLAGEQIAAVIMETIPATYGFPMPPDGYLLEIKRLCERTGTLYIADEVQTGLGRTGTLWGVEQYGVEPDILVTAKGFSGGVYPIAAVGLRANTAGWLTDHGWGHVATFGGSEIGCRVAQRVLEITSRDSVVENVEHLAEHLRQGLEAIRVRQPFLRGVRQRGLVMGLETDHPQGAVYLQKALYDLGVWGIAAGYDLSVLQFKPGLLMDTATADAVLDRLDAALVAAREMDWPIASRHKVTRHR